MKPTPRPADYVLIEGDRVYDVRCIGGGPYLWAMETVERMPPPPRGWLYNLRAWWAR